MKILSIDTSSKICGVAILEDAKLIHEINLDSGLTHSEKLMPTLKESLEINSLNLKDIDLIVCDQGPGSFTGIRIGIATIKAFSDALNIPTIGISSLEALAYNVKENGLICSVIDAKNENVYFGLFENHNNSYTSQFEYSAIELGQLLQLLKVQKNEITFVGDASVIYKDIILQTLPNSKFCIQNDLSAYNLGLAGYKKFQKNPQSENVQPLYLRKSQAERIMEAKLNEA